MPLSGSGTWREFACSRRRCESRFREKLFRGKYFSGRSVFIFPSKKSAGGEGMPMKRLNRLSASTAREVRLKVSGRQLPARLQDERNDRSLEAHKITSLTSAWGNSGSAKTRSCLSITIRQENET
jgi:hypothetical protein